MTVSTHEWDKAEDKLSYLLARVKSQAGAQQLRALRASQSPPVSEETAVTQPVIAKKKQNRPGPRDPKVTAIPSKLEVLTSTAVTSLASVSPVQRGQGAEEHSSSNSNFNAPSPPPPPPPPT